MDTNSVVTAAVNCCVVPSGTYAVVTAAVLCPRVQGIENEKENRRFSLSVSSHIRHNG